MRIRFVIYGLIGVLFLVSQNLKSAYAQEIESPLSAVFACADIADDRERWTCYDEQVPKLRSRDQKKEIITIDSEKAEEIEREAFGFSLPKLNILRPKYENQKKEKNVQTFQISSIDRKRSGLKITMKNGQVWQQLSGESGYVPKGKLNATIKPASFGSFLLSIQNEDGKSVRRGLRVRRVK